MCTTHTQSTGSASELGATDEYMRVEPQAKRAHDTTSEHPCDLSRRVMRTGQSVNQSINQTLPPPPRTPLRPLLEAPGRGIHTRRGPSARCRHTVSTHSPPPTPHSACNIACAQPPHHPSPACASPTPFTPFSHRRGPNAHTTHHLRHAIRHCAHRNCPNRWLR